MRCLLLVALLARGSAFSPRAPDPKLKPRTYTPFPLRSITPGGWLLDQLKLQAQGLSGHLAQFWPDIAKSVWVGGGGDGGLHERTPYWLNGVVPLAFLLQNANDTQLMPVAGLYKAASLNSWLHPNASHTIAPAADCGGMGSARENTRRSGRGVQLQELDLMQQVECYINYIISHQGPDGWLGPADENNGVAPWGRANIILALAQYAEANPARMVEITGVMTRYLLALKKRLVATPLKSWAEQRWQDLALGVHWLLDNAALTPGQAQELWDLCATMYKQGLDWESFFEAGKFTGDNGHIHNVNIAQALKSAAVLFRQTGNATLKTLSHTRVEHLDAVAGLPTGVYVGDELVDTTHNPSRGFELCGVVEAMFSYSTMFSTFGNTRDLDRMERISFNALPATWASPRGGDMWAHQYLQAVNQIAAKKEHPHIWTHDGDDSETYGLEPNYGCCTANFNQGWPKFTANIFYQTADNGVVIGLLAPAAVALPASIGGAGARVTVETRYPFEDVVNITAQAPDDFPLYVRVPGWTGADGATLVVEQGKSPPLTIAAKNGTLLHVPLTPPLTRATLVLTPKMRVERWSQGGHSVHRGPLVFALPLDPLFTVTAHHFGDDDMSNDYEVIPASPWQYALAADPADPAADLTFETRGLRPGAPFNHSGWPVVVHAKLRSLPSWGLDNGSAAEPPLSPACKVAGACGDAEPVVLVPFGSTDLRIGAFPLA